MKTALLVKMSSLGDVVHALPAVSDAALHGWQFDWVVEEAFADIPARHHAVRQVLPIAWRRWRRALWRYRGEMREFRRSLKAGSYDVVLDSQGLLKSAAVVRLAEGDATAGFDRDSAREPLASRSYEQAFNVPRRQHAIDRQRQLFAAALGYEPGGALRFGLEMPATDAPGKVCVFLHGTTWESKHYPEALWLDLAECAGRDGYQVAVTWGDDAERQRAELLAEQGGAQIWPRGTLGELTQRLIGADLVVGVDSGLTHLAAALGVPTVGLYGSTDAVLTGCRGTAAIALAADFACAPCLQKRCSFEGEVVGNRYGLIRPACYATLNADTVWHHAMERVRARRFLHL